MSNNLLVLQTDFGLVDGAVSAMIGVALQENPSLGIHHLTHDITPYNIFEASYRLFQTIEYWPEGTTFVSVVDPGVGSKRKSVVALTANNHYIVTPEFGDRFEVTIYNNDMLVYQNQVTYGKSFADVRIGQPIIYINSLYRVGIAINQGSFAKAYNVGVGQNWHVAIKKIA